MKVKVNQEPDDFIRAQQMVSFVESAKALLEECLRETDINTVHDILRFL
jgi:hypothetical protein